MSILEEPLTRGRLGRTGGEGVPQSFRSGHVSADLTFGFREDSTFYLDMGTAHFKHHSKRSNSSLETVHIRTDGCEIEPGGAF